MMLRNDQRMRQQSPRRRRKFVLCFHRNGGFQHPIPKRLNEGKRAMAALLQPQAQLGHRATDHMQGQESQHQQPMVTIVARLWFGWSLIGATDRQHEAHTEGMVSSSRTALLPRATHGPGGSECKQARVTSNGSRAQQRACFAIQIGLGLQRCREKQSKVPCSRSAVTELADSRMQAITATSWSRSRQSASTLATSWGSVDLPPGYGEQRPQQHRHQRGPPAGPSAKA